jgi:hypothetical protein
MTTTAIKPPEVSSLGISDNNAPIACSLSHTNQAEQLRRWRELSERADATIEPTASGLRLSFLSHRGVEEELSELTALEQRCCAFAHWSIRASSQHVVLTISGDSPEAVAAIQGMFGGLRGSPDEATRGSESLASLPVQPQR